jgi:hypothetical protein
MRRRRPARDLRLAIDCMPLPARVAMLEGIEANRIIAGAYTDRDGGVCPMLAAHRRGGRTSLASFARAWDRYTGARRRARPATARELNTLRAMLEASIALEETPALEAPRRQRRETGERHRGRELRRRPGWAWLRPFRRLDEYDRALSELDVAVTRSDELDLRDDAGRRGSEQVADRLSDVLGPDHLVLRDLPLDPVGHRGRHESRT